MTDRASILEELRRLSEIVEALQNRQVVAPQSQSQSIDDIKPIIQRIPDSVQVELKN